MFTSKIKIPLGVSILILGAIVGANAQINDGSAVKFDVSHSFVINGKTLPAGKYSISTVSATDGEVLKLQSMDGKEAMLFSILQKIHNEPAKNTELVFDQIGDTYFLTEIRTKGNEVGIQVEKSRSEKEAIAAAASN